VKIEKIRKLVSNKPRAPRRPPQVIPALARGNKALAKTMRTFATASRTSELLSRRCGPTYDDRAAFFTEPSYHGDAKFVRPLTDLSNLGGGYQSFRKSPFHIDITYNVIADGADFPNDNFDPQSLLDLFVQLNELNEYIEQVHGRVREIWLPYLVCLRKTPMFRLFFGEDTVQYFNVEDGELGVLDDDPTFGWTTDRLNCVLVNDMWDGVLGVAGTGDIADGRIDHPTFIATLRDSGPKTARTIAHEIGHKFGLGHQNDNPTWLMCQTGSAQSPTENQVYVSNAEASTVHKNLASNDETYSSLRRETSLIFPPIFA
jgi:hypothetical protein